MRWIGIMFENSKQKKVAARTSKNVKTWTLIKPSILAKRKGPPLHSLN